MNPNRFLLLVAVIATLNALSAPSPARPDVRDQAEPSPVLGATAPHDVESPAFPVSADGPAGAVSEPFSRLQQYGDEPTLVPVRVRGYDARTGQAVFAEGTAVEVSPGQFQTVAHIRDGLRSGYVVEVNLDGDWQRVHFVPNTGADFATLTLAGISSVDTNGIQNRPPRYLETVRVKGLKSNCWQVGTVSNLDPLTVSLAETEPGIEQGDSGGAVLGDDGALLGVIHGRSPNEHRIVYWTAAAGTLPSSVAQPAQTGAEPVQAQSNCVGGQCYQQPQRFLFRGRLFR